ncbi:MAG: hypothetical protein ACRCWJ_16410 [Casimicrobium sp.]
MHIGNCYRRCWRKCHCDRGGQFYFNGRILNKGIDLYTFSAQFVAMLRATLESLPFKDVAHAISALTAETQRQDRELFDRHVADQVAKAAKTESVALPEIKAD